MKCKKSITGLAYGIGLALVAGQAAAHGLDDVGAPACLEANFMMANAQNAPFAAGNGPGNVLEVNIVTGARGITVNNPFGGPPTDGSSPVCGGDGVNNNPFISCAGDGDGKAPFKPTGVLSGGLNGHAFITSAAQQALTEFHRDGTPIRSVSFRPLLGNPSGNAGLGSLPRPLGTQMMPNGNIIQAICDANFFNAQNSDREDGYTDPTGADPGNISYKYFPPVYSTPARAQNSRLLVLDQESLEVIDEYSYPHDDARAQLWGCMAGIAFTEEGMGVSMFHTAAIAMVDWMEGTEDVPGVGSNNPPKKGFKIGEAENEAEITRWIDLRAEWDEDEEEIVTVADDDPSRRDSLRAWGLDEDGTIYVTDRERNAACEEGDACSPANFRQKVQVVDLGNDYPSRTIGLDPGVNIIAGIRPNRMSAVACANIGGTGTDCDVETLLLAASAFNPGINNAGAGFMKPGGGVGEYSIHPADADAQDGTCTGEHGNAAANTGCAQPIAQFLGSNPDVGGADLVDPRMLMVIHEAFVQ